MPDKNESQKLLRREVRLLGGILGQVICQQSGPEIFGLEERIRILAKSRRSNDDALTDAELTELVNGVSIADKEAVARAFTLYFELVNLAEEHHRVRVLREWERDSQRRAEPLGESIAAAIGKLSEMGVKEADIAKILDQLSVELVFTAHPTEAKRRTVLSKLWRIGQALHDLETNDLLPSEHDALLNNIRAEVTLLWVTERNRTSKPTVKDEVRTGLFHFYSTLWDTIPQVYRSMDWALAKYYPNLKTPPRFLTFGSWIGGDRDGNPFVTSQATAEASQRYRRLAAERHARVAHPLSRSLSMSNRLAEVDPALLEWIARQEGLLSGHVTRLSKRYPTETYRTVAAHVAAELDAAYEDRATDRLLGLGTAEPPPKLRTTADVLEPLEMMAASLRADGLGSVAEITMSDFCRQVEVFGMHTARLDIRQYSTYHHEVLSELLERLGYVEGYAARSSVERTALLNELFEKPIPDLNQLTDLSEETADTVSLFTMLQRLVENYGPESLGPYLISMTQGIDDVLVVLLLAKWSGLCLNPNRSCEALTLAPLFETRSDLHDAPAIMSQLFTHPIYEQHLAVLGNRQTIMIGYSDSNKDAGYIAAQWELFRAQETISETCHQYHIDLTLFHGRGGTIARGGGPTNRAILAQPAGSVNGKIRITEQGEVIAERYGNPAIARRHLEQVVNAVLMTSAPAHEAHTTPLNKWRQVMDQLAQAGYQAYRKLIYETPELLEYWQQATPIQEISQLQIGSRPSRRAPGNALATLRAIPWVFSWMQSRHVLPGWYGLGTALAAYGTTPERIDDLKEMYRSWPFFQNAIDNAQVSLGKADMGIARLYAELVEDERVRELIFSDIETEFKLTAQTILQITEQKKILEHDKTLQHSIRLRNPYVDPLNFIQVSLLRQLRALPDQAGDEAQQILRAIMLTINGIAAGLKNTG